MLFLALICVFPNSAKAQTGKFSLTSGGYAAAAGTKSGTPPSVQSPSGTKAVVNLQFGDVSPRSASSKVICTVPIKISSDKAYKIEIKRADLAETGGPRPKDIGFGVTNVRAAFPGSHQLSGSALAVSVAGGFASNPSAVTMSGGLPQFAATLENIPSGVGTTVLNGPATTVPSSVGQDEGSILADLVFVIVPQYFDVTDNMNLALTVTITPAE